MNRRWLVVFISSATVVEASAQEAFPACSVSIAVPPRRLELPDGQAVSTDVKSAAFSRGSVMALGRYAYVFPRGASPRTDAVMRDSIIGFVIDARGVVSTVPEPAGVGRVSLPRVASAPDGSFHVLFVTTADDQNGAIPPADTATLWYARFRNGGWTKPEVITRTFGARLIFESSSQLIERNGELSFLFPFKWQEAQGLVLLRRQAGTWRSDTLPTLEEVLSVDATHERDGTLVAAFIAPGRRINRSFAEVVYVARFSSSWSAAQYAGGGSAKPVTMTRVVRGDRRLMVSWLSWRWGDATTSELQALRSGADSVPTLIASGSATYPFEAVALDDRFPVWITRGPQYGSTLSVFVGAPPAVRRHDFEVPFENPKASTAFLSSDRALVLTMKQGKSPGEPMVASYATVLQFRCPDPARR
jgi:hypothetical protein